MACVYQHIREDNGNPMYIGISSHDFPGIELISKNTNHRACQISNRTTLHTRYFKKYNCKVEILHNNLSWEDACNLEKEYIKKYGRIDNKTGILTNMTDGGEGAIGRIPTTEHKNNLSKALKGRKFSDEHKLKLAQSAKITCNRRGTTTSIQGRINIGKGKAGFKQPEEAKQRISKALKGRIAPNKGMKMPETTKAALIKATAKTHYFEDNFGSVIVIENLRKYCNDNDLNYERLRSVKRGLSKEYNGLKNIKL
jgi:hypothetical protein